MNLWNDPINELKEKSEIVRKFTLEESIEIDNRLNSAFVENNKIDVDPCSMCPNNKKWSICHCALPYRNIITC